MSPANQMPRADAAAPNVPAGPVGAPPPGATSNLSARLDEKVSQHGKRAMVVAGIFVALILGGLLVDSIVNPPKPVAAKVETPPAKPTTEDPFADFEAKQRAEMARMDEERRKLAKQRAAVVPELPASAPPRTPEQELRELARLEDLKRGLGALKSPDMVAASARRNDSRGDARVDGRSGAARQGGQGEPSSNASQAESTLAQLKEAIGRARAGGAGGPGAAGAVPVKARAGDELTGPFARDLKGSEASGTVVGQAATARGENGEGRRRGEYLLPVGSVLSAVLDMEVSSDWEGRWRAMLTRDVYDAAQDVILLPKGTRVLGTTAKIAPVNEAINERMALAARWAVLPNGARIDLSRTGTLDQGGIAAIAGDVNRHFLATLAGVAAYGVIGGVGAVTTLRNIGTSDNNAQVSIGASAGSVVAGGLVDIGRRVAGRYLNLVPTVTLKPGTAMTIFLDDEMYLLPWAPVDETFSAMSSRTSGR
jgi:type IV secretory pathway VirB10-like protein